RIGAVKRAPDPTEKIAHRAELGSYGIVGRREDAVGVKREVTGRRIIDRRNMIVRVEAEISRARGVLFARVIAAGDGDASGARRAKDIIHAGRAVGVAKSVEEAVDWQLIRKRGPGLDSHGGVVAQNTRRQL